MNVVAFALGLISLGLVKADVSHLRPNQFQRNSMFVANNGQVVKQSFNSNGDATYSSRSYNNNAGSPQEVNNFFQPQQAFESGRVQQSSSCDSNSACVAPKFCFNGFVDQSAAHKAQISASGRCFAPEVCCRLAQRRNAPYNQDNTVSAAESTSEILTKEGYVVRKPSNQYLPGLPDRNPAPSNDQNTYIRPTTARPVTYAPRPVQPVTYAPRPVQPVTYAPRPVQPRPVQPQPRPQQPYQPQPTNNRPVIQYDPAPIVIPIGCSAAMNCTNIQYCTAAGIISKTPVSLNPQQEMFRVPLTDCREPTTKEVGKCCRDPDYVDPWPVGRTGQYVAEELNAVYPSGAYKPEPSGPISVRVKPDGYVLPQPSNTQQRLYLPPNSNRI